MTATVVHTQAALVTYTFFSNDQKTILSYKSYVGIAFVW